MPKYDPYPEESEQEFLARMFADLRTRSGAGNYIGQNYPAEDEFDRGAPYMVDPRYRALQDMMDAMGPNAYRLPQPPEPQEEIPPEYFDDVERPKRQPYE